MKLAYLLYALLMLSGLFSCVANEKTEMPVIPVDLENSRKKVSLSDITEEVKNIHLELTEHSLISDLVTRVIYTDDYIFLIDRKNPTPIMFDGNGKFLRTIGSMGQGPGEFTGLIDIAADFQNEYLYITTLSKLLLYDFDGNFYHERKYVEEHVRYANFTNGSLILISERDEDGEDGRIQKTNLDFVSTDLEITDSLHLKTYVNPRMLWWHSHQDFITESSGNVYQYYYEFNSEPFLRDTLYQLEGNERIPSLKVDFGTTGVDVEGERTLALWNIYRSNRYVFSAYWVADRYMRFCYDLKEMTGYNMEKGYEDDINHSGIVDIRPLNTDTERYYYFYTQERHSEEENQVLCIGTLKK